MQRKVMMKALATSAVLLGAYSPAAGAATIATATFDDTVKSQGADPADQTMTGIDWTGDDLASVTANTTVSYVGIPGDGFFDTGFGATGFAPDQNIENQGPWSATFELTFNGGATGTLRGISFDWASLNNNGATQGSNFRAQNFDITVNGNVFEGQKQTTAVDGFMTFTDTAALNAGSNLIVITSSRGTSTAGYNMGIDDLTFTGDIVVPEPGSLALLSMGGLLMDRRRRRA